MGFIRFRRSIRIAPGLRVNFGKRSVSLSAGGRGATVTMGPQGLWSNIGIPGTGLTYRHRFDGNSGQQNAIKGQQRFGLSQQLFNEMQDRQNTSLRVKLTLHKETGELEIGDAFGKPLSSQLLKMLWDQNKKMILEFLNQQVEEINGNIELLTTIHEDTPSPNLEPEYQILPFDEQEPSQPSYPYKVPEPELTLLPPLGFFQRLFKNKRMAHEEKQQQLKHEHEKALLAWDAAGKKDIENYQAVLEKYRELKIIWDSHKKEHEDNETKKKEKFPELLRTDENVMDKTLEDALHSLSWPRETLVSYQIMMQGHQVWLDVDLPEIEDLPQKQAAVASNGKKINIKNKTAKQLQAEYALHIHGIVFRLVGTVFATLPTADIAIISGFSQRIDRSTGKVNDDYLLSVRVEREQYSKIDFDSLDKVNPIEALGAFEIRRKLSSTGVFIPIDPFEPSSV